MQFRKHVFGLLAVVLMTACSDAGEPVAGPQVAKLQGSSSLRLVKTNSVAANAVTALIGRDGGVLTDVVTGHSLEIPRGAVSEPTYFVMGNAEKDVFVVKLLAYKAKDLSPVTQFTAKPLKLRMNYTDAEVVSPRRLKIVYVSDDLTQILEVLSTSVSKSHIEASISHFSIYSMAID
jgi:hypothetical protein